MGAYQVIVLQRSASKSWEKFSSASPFSAFRDASEGASYHDCTILNCLRGLERAIKLNWFSFDTFDLDFYESHDKVETGDMTWIIPSKLLAFSCPSIKEEDGWGNYTPETYVEVFKKIGVTAVIRLNHATYESSRFTSKGIRHYELYFPDGSCPSTDMLIWSMELWPCTAKLDLAGPGRLLALMRLGSLILMLLISLLGAGFADLGLLSDPSNSF
jgi:cell division cycle 14